MNTLNQSITRDVHSYLNSSWREIYKYFNEFSIEEMAQYFTGAIDGTFVVPKIDYTTLVTIAKDYMLNSDLSDKQSQELYHLLKKLGFFESISNRLYAAHFHHCSWSIYALAAFKNSENAPILEYAYETSFSKSNPILAYRCLYELNEFNSPNSWNYVQTLKRSSTILSKLTLFYFYEALNNQRELYTIKSDKKFQHFLWGKYSLKMEDKTHWKNRLNSFENFCFDYFETTDFRTINEVRFEALAADYFINN